MKIRALWLFALLFPVLLAARPQAADSGLGGLSPTQNQAQTAQFVYHFLSGSRFHYKPEPLDDTLSAEIFRRYLDALDNERLFFTQADIERFAPLRTQLDDAILNQQLEPAFDVFNVYLQRVAERTAFARALLKQDFDFTTDESYRQSRDKLPWEPDTAALHQVWRKRVKNDVLRLKLAGREMPAIRDTLDKRYANFEQRVRQINSDDVFQTFMNAYAIAIEPHTGYMTPRTSENFNISMRLSLEGIGAVLQRDEDVTVVRSIVPGGPAAVSGKLKVGDRIVGVGQGQQGPVVDVVGWRIDDVVELIRGPKDSYVRLSVVVAEATMDATPEVITLARQKVKLEEQAAKKSVLEIGEGEHARRIGVITLPTFYLDFEARRRREADYRSSTRDVARLLDELKAERVDGVLIDLRNNGGGSLAEATELTGLFIDRGPVVQVRDTTGRVQVEKDPKPGVAYAGPLAVLINRASASASEIFAGAIQDYGRGVVIGEPTFGKGTVQNLIDLDGFARNETPRFGQLKLTTAQFFRVSGSSTQHKGVVPDVQFPVTLDAHDYGESAYDNALPWTSIDGAEYRRVADLAPLVPLLTQRHQLRSAKDLEFGYWTEDVADYRKLRAQTTISLNEAVRRAEREQSEQRRKTRDEARKAAGAALAAESRDAQQDDGLLPDERDIVAQAKAEEADAEQPDVLLREGASVLADAIGLLATDRALAARVYPRGEQLPASN